MDEDRKKDVFTMIPSGKKGPDGKDKSYFVRIGVGWVNSDGSLNLKLDALPVNGSVHVRKHESEEERKARFAARNGSQPVAFG